MPPLDVYLILFEPEIKGKWPEVLKVTLAVRDGILKQDAIAGKIRRIEALHDSLGKSGLGFALAERIL